MKAKSSQKHILRIFLCALLVSILSGAALADVIWEPNDDFYQSNSEQCKYVNRDFFANGKSGYLEVFKKPDGENVGFADNSKLLHVQFSYEKSGEVWGVIEYSKENDKIIPADYSLDTFSGWVKMSELIVKYDYLAFENDYGSSFVPYDGDYSTLKGAEKVVMWTYPGSGEISGTLDDISDDFAVGSAYTDESGTKWGYVGYYYGMKNFWICMDDPANENLPAVIKQEIGFNTPTVDSVPEKNNDLTTIVIICVAAVVLISALLIFVMRKK